jgi:hypothetical protein
MKPHPKCVLFYNGKGYWCAEQYINGLMVFVRIDKQRQIIYRENSTVIAEMFCIFNSDLFAKMKVNSEIKILETYNGSYTVADEIQINLKALNYAVQK